MLVRSTIYIAVGLLLVAFGDIISARLDIPIDLAWLLVVAAAFAFPAELAPVAGIIFGLTLDGLSGSIWVYTFSYGGFGAAVLLVRKLAYIDGFVAAWIVAVIGSQILWLFMGMIGRGINILGGSVDLPGWFSPFLVSSLILFPLIFLGARKLLVQPVDVSKSHHYGATVRIIDKT